MHIHIITSAKPQTTNTPETTLYQRYAERLNWSIQTHYIPPKKNHIKQLLAACPKNSHISLCDETGKQYSSIAFAKFIEQCQQQGHQKLCFLVGGADGHPTELHQHCHHKLSLGPMTYPHRFIPFLLTEQLYRAHTILNHHPYHH